MKLPICDHCEKRHAVCVGQYDNMEHPEYACDSCCQHGCEDGVCYPLSAGRCSYDDIAAMHARDKEAEA